MSYQDDGGKASDMTLRDYFAAEVMKGIITASGDSDGEIDYDERVVAENAYALAVVMLEARKCNDITH